MPKKAAHPVGGVGWAACEEKIVLSARLLRSRQAGGCICSVNYRYHTGLARFLVFC
jgi:hypothetical protein